MAYTWTLALPIRNAYSRGMVGSDIAALQLNLQVLGFKPGGIDGDFGAGTEAAVKAYQQQQFGPDDVDGVVGPRTFQRIVVQQVYAATETYRLPTGLLKSFASSESNFRIGACAAHPSDAGYDVGALQLSSGADATPGQDFFLKAYDVRAAADYSGQKARASFDQQPKPVDSQYFAELADNHQNLFKWQMVALNHNWPYAAYNIPRRGHIFNDPARDDQPAQWIIDFTNNRLQTPRQWVTLQVQTKTVYLVI